MNTLRFAWLAAVALLPGCAALPARDSGTALEVPAHGVIGVDEAKLTPAFWIERQADPDRVELDRAAIDAENARLYALDPSMHDLRALPATLAREQVAAWIGGISIRPDDTLFGVDGKPIAAATLDALVAALDTGAIPARQPTRYGLIIQRAALRTFPTALRVFDDPGNTDIDRFQETALFPGTPVVIAHESADRRWLFVVSPRYAAWVERAAVAEGSAAAVLGYVDRKPYRVITGGNVRTVFTPAQPAVSQLQLDMGMRVPIDTGWPPDRPVNGQHPYTAWVIDLPLRAADGSLHFTPALLQKNADSAPDVLALTPANLIRQAFKFLGERYGWGHDYDGRDCSGFVSDVYRSFGIEMPRNTSRQSVSPALDRRGFTATDDHATRLGAALELGTGDLVYIPGHVMMVIGRVDGKPWVIHDTGGIRYRKADGSIAQVKLNAVSVTPLLPLLFNDHQSYIDRMTSVVRFRQRAARGKPSP